MTRRNDISTIAEDNELIDDKLLQNQQIIISSQNVDESLETLTVTLKNINNELDLLYTKFRVIFNYIKKI